MIDIYFETNYGRLYEKIEGGTCEVFEYHSSNGTIRHMFIKREIPIRLGDITYYDLITPYGYGGPLVLNYEMGRKEELVDEFEVAFEQYCGNNNIVSEFVRFHPVVGNAVDFRSCYSIKHIRNTVGTRLADTDDPFQTEFSKSCRRNVRKALKNGVDYRIIENPTDVNCFKQVYYSTMNRNDASDFYYFDDWYFDQCVQLFRDKLLLVEALFQQEVIAMGLYFVYNDTIHIHLSGTLSEFLYLSPAYVLRYAITMWGKDHGYTLIHHGGGRTNDSNDGLYLFKKQFGNSEFRFCVGTRIWNDEIYRQLCGVRILSDNTDFFPAYRA